MEYENPELQQLQDLVDVSEIEELIGSVNILIDEEKNNKEIMSRVRNFIYGPSELSEERPESMEVLEIGLIPYINFKIPEKSRDYLMEKVRNLEKKLN